MRCNLVFRNTTLFTDLHRQRKMQFSPLRGVAEHLRCRMDTGHQYGSEQKTDLIKLFDKSDVSLPICVIIHYINVCYCVWITNGQILSSMKPEFCLLGQLLKPSVYWALASSMTCKYFKEAFPTIKFDFFQIPWSIRKPISSSRLTSYHNLFLKLNLKSVHVNLSFLF